MSRSRSGPRGSTRANARIAAAGSGASSTWYVTFPDERCRVFAHCLRSTSRRTWRLRPSSSTFMSMPMREVFSTVTQARRAPGSAWSTRRAARRRASASASDPCRRSTARTMIGACARWRSADKGASRSAPSAPMRRLETVQKLSRVIRSARAVSTTWSGCCSSKATCAAVSGRLARLDLQAMQDDLLQPGRAGSGRAPAAGSGPGTGAAAGRGRVVGLPNGPLSGGQDVEQDTEREEIAARIASDVADLLRGDVRSRSRSAGEIPRPGGPGAGRAATARSRSGRPRRSRGT